MSTKIEISNKASQVIALLNKAIAKSKNGVTFLSISNYTNKNGEIANHLINLGAKYETAKQKDIEFLRNFNVTDLDFKSEYTKIETARTELLQSFLTPNENRSNGQIDAYTFISVGLKVHNETGLLYIYGLRANKTVLQKGTYKEVKSSELTIAKNEIRKHLKTGQFTQYAIEVGNTIKCIGETLEL
jgi:hypothetical protein